MFEPGTVWLVGAGPGDPGYLTVNALRALQQADTILHDALIDDRILDLARSEAARSIPASGPASTPSTGRPFAPAWSRWPGRARGCCG